MYPKEAKRLFNQKLLWEMPWIPAHLRVAPAHLSETRRFSWWVNWRAALDYLHGENSTQIAKRYKVSPPRARRMIADGIQAMLDRGYLVSGTRQEIQALIPKSSLDRIDH